MPRSIWSGAISFGLVNIPVSVHSAVQDKDVKFNQINATTGNRIAQKRVDAVTGDEVPYEAIVKGYEVSKGSYVTVTGEELASLFPASAKVVEVERFVSPGSINPVAFESSYYLSPGNAGAKPYALLHAALVGQNKIAIGRMMMRGYKEHVVAIYPEGDALVLSRLHYADEVVPIENLGIEPVVLSAAEQQMAEMLVGSLVDDEFDLGVYTDTTREKVLELIQRKADGEQIVIENAPVPAASTDLLAALEASLAALKQAPKPSPQQATAANG